MTSKYRRKIAEPNPAVKRRIMCAIQTPDCTRKISLLYCTPSVKDRTSAQEVKCCPLNSEAWVQLQTNLCGIRGVSIGSGKKMDFSGY
jgi:hypothetical protein